MTRNDLEKNELLVLKAMSSQDDYMYNSFRGIQYSIDEDIEIKDIRKACRSLAEKGLAHYMNGLMDEDGKVAGSGYQCTDEGKALVSPCDFCSRASFYDYKVDKDGEFTPYTKDAKEVQECELHHGYSKKEIKEQV